jgi:flavin-dependent dehydrogenase
MLLEDGSRVAVIGGGPAGTMFSYFLLRTLELTDTQIQLDIYEPRDFSFSGPAGCNHCGGVVSESLVQLLATEGIVLSETVVQRGIQAYRLHMDVGSVSIRTPLKEKRIAAIYRGNGPRNSVPTSLIGFDRHLLDLAVEKGANVVRKLVEHVSWPNGRPHVHCPDGHEGEYDLVVVASGVNSAVLRLVEDLGLGFRAPGTVKTFISEYHLGHETISEHLGPAMHVFLLDLPRLKFAAAIPKGDYVTVVMLGKDIDDDLVKAFMNSPEVRDCFPGGVVPANSCHCFPRINIRAARQPYADRLVIIGDSGVSRLYKDGIGAAYRTAKAAAMTVALHGVSEQAFAAQYWPTCRRINFDNRLGKFIFSFSNLIQTNRFARNAVLRMTALEQASENRPRRMSSVLWDLFTGSAPYRDVFVRTLHPKFLGGVVWNLIAGNWAARKRKMEESLS